MFEIEYRNVSYRAGAYGSGKLIRQTEASVGDIRRTGANKTEAKAALLEALAEQARYAYVRRYLVGTGADGEPVTFALSYCDGWCYDIVRSYGRSSSTMLEAANQTEALEKMRHHFDQYTAPSAALATASR